jgi:hypothetical protein
MHEQTIAAAHPTEVWAALGGTVTAVVVLMTYIWNRQNADIKGISDEVKFTNARLDAEQKAFANIGEQFVKIGEQLKALEKEDVFSGEEFDRLGVDIKLLAHDLTVLKTEHKNCIGRLGK